MTKKSIINELIPIANNHISIIANTDSSIDKAYNGKCAALGVSIAMTGLLPTLAIYSRSEGTEADKGKILMVITKMLKSYKPEVYGKKIDKVDANALLSYALKLDDNGKNALKSDMIDCAIALKLVVRTYKLVG